MATATKNGKGKVLKRRTPTQPELERVHAFASMVFKASEKRARGNPFAAGLAPVMYQIMVDAEGIGHGVGEITIKNGKPHLDTSKYETKIEEEFDDWDYDGPLLALIEELRPLELKSHKCQYSDCACRLVDWLPACEMLYCAVKDDGDLYGNIVNFKEGTWPEP